MHTANHLNQTAVCLFLPVPALVGYIPKVHRLADLSDLCDSLLASRSGQSHGFSLDSDEREGDEPAVKQRPGEERRERPEETQRSSWERRTPTDDRRRKREDSEPRLFIACDDMQDTQDPLEGADKSGSAELALSYWFKTLYKSVQDVGKRLLNLRRSVGGSMCLNHPELCAPQTRSRQL